MISGFNCIPFSAWILGCATPLSKLTNQETNLRDRSHVSHIPYVWLFHWLECLKHLGILVEKKLLHRKHWNRNKYVPHRKALAVMPNCAETKSYLVRSHSNLEAFSWCSRDIPKLVSDDEWFDRFDIAQYIDWPAVHNSGYDVLSSSM